MALEKFLEVCGDGLDHTNHFLKALHDKQRTRLTLKDYLEGQCDLHVHYVLKRDGRESAQFCAVLKLYEGKVESTEKL